MAFLDLMTQAWDLSNQSLYGMYQNLVLRDRDSIAYSERDLATEIPLVLGWTFVITIFLYSLRNYILEPIGVRNKKKSKMEVYRQIFITLTLSSPSPSPPPSLYRAGS